MARKMLVSGEAVFLSFASHQTAFVSVSPFSTRDQPPTPHPTPHHSGSVHVTRPPFQSCPDGIACSVLLIPDSHAATGRLQSTIWSPSLATRVKRRPLDFGGAPQSALIALHPEFEERGIESRAISQHSQGSRPMRLIQFPLSSPEAGGTCPARVTHQQVSVSGCEGGPAGGWGGGLRLSHPGDPRSPQPGLGISQQTRGSCRTSRAPQGTGRKAGLLLKGSGQSLDRSSIGPGCW